MFQQRHFEAITQMMQELHPQMPDTSDAAYARMRQWTTTVNALSELFARHNDRFSLGHFERACEPGANVRAARLADAQCCPVCKSPNITRNFTTATLICRECRHRQPSAVSCDRPWR